MKKHWLLYGESRQYVYLEDVRVGQLLSAAADAVQHEGEMLVVLLEDDLEDAVLLREAGRHVVEDVRQLHHKLVRRVEDVALQGQQQALSQRQPTQATKIRDALAHRHIREAHAICLGEQRQMDLWMCP